MTRTCAHMRAREVDEGSGVHHSPIPRCLCLLPAAYHLCLCADEPRLASFAQLADAERGATRIWRDAPLRSPDLHYPGSPYLRHDWVVGGSGIGSGR